jgi:hypothetical protein
LTLRRAGLAHAVTVA